MERIIEQLWNASGKDKAEVSPGNLFKTIGFDGDKARLGWVLPPPWRLVEESLRSCLGLMKNKKEFIFVGMGGSANGIKTIISLKNTKNVHCLDSLDPEAVAEVVSKIKNLKNTVIIPISKSGTTEETQLIAYTLRDLFKKNAGKNFLWLVDKGSSSKLDSLGWRGFKRLSIQVDGLSDVGGRFSSPHTLIFFLPLFLAMERDFSKLKKAYEQYISLTDKIVKKAFDDASRYSKRKNAYFSIIVPSNIRESFATWVTQLFQESIGSKKTGLSVKTLVLSKKNKYDSFGFLNLNIESKSLIVKLMAQMYYLQNFVAIYSYYKKINFVNQPCVEKYKKTMKALSFNDITEIRSCDYKSLIGAVTKKIKIQHKFIEIILYFHPKSSEISAIGKLFKKYFPNRRIFIFIGSDWNHHSYQAAYQDKESLYVLLLKDGYSLFCPGVDRKYLTRNYQTLRLIGYATYLTLKKNALLLALGGR